MKKRIILSLLGIMMVFQLFSGNVSAAEKRASDVVGEEAVYTSQAASTITAKGIYGNLSWSLTGEGTLTISGTGAMKKPVYETDQYPWYTHNEKIVSLVINKGVTTIADGAFCECYKLKKVQLPSGLVSIGDNAFERCEELAACDLPQGIKKLGQYAFACCGKLDHITIPSSVTDIGDGVFLSCISLKTIKILCRITVLPESIFYSCDSLTDFVVPESVTEIGDRAFFECENLKTITMSSGLKTIGNCAFMGCSRLTGVKIPSHVKSIGRSAFAYCTRLSAISVDKENKYYLAQDGVLFNKDKTVLLCYPDGKKNTGYEIPYGVKRIQEYALGGNYLKKITVPATVTAIESYAFNGFCTEVVKFSGKKPSFEMDALFGGYEHVGQKVTIYYPDIWQGKLPSGGEDVTIKWISQKTYATPAISSAANSGQGVALKWKAVSGAEKYRVLRKSSSGGWKKITDTASNSYTDTSVKSGTTYTYTVRCIAAKGSDDISDGNLTGKTIKYLSSPSVSVSNVSGGITVKWGKITGASGYYVYRKNGSSWDRIKTIKNSSALNYTDTTVKSKNGTTYVYKVKAYSGSYTSSSISGKKIVRLTPPSISGASNSASKKMTVKWSKNSKATGYQIKYVTGSASKTVTVKGASTVSKTITGLTKGKTYKVYVRSYKTVSGVNYYSGWSSAKSVIISK